MIAGSRLINLSAHDALIILKNSLSLPKLLFHSRCCYSGDHPVLPLIEDKLRDLMSQILNVELSGDHWEQATLPVKLGGLGTRKPTQIAPSAYLASVSDQKTWSGSFFLLVAADILKQQVVRPWQHGKEWEEKY